MNINNYKTMVMIHLTDPNIKSHQKEAIIKELALEQADQVFSALVKEKSVMIDESDNVNLTDHGAEKAKRMVHDFIAHIWSPKNAGDGSIEDFYNALGRLSQFFFEDTETLNKWFEKKWKFRQTLMENDSAPFKGELAYNAFQNMEIEGRCFVGNVIEENNERKTYMTYAFEPRCRVAFHDGKGEIILTPLTHITTEYENIVGDKIVSLTSYDPEKDEHTEIPLKNGVFHIPVEHCTLWYHLDDVTFDGAFFYGTVAITVQTKLGWVVVYRPLTVILT